MFFDCVLVLSQFSRELLAVFDFAVDLVYFPDGGYQVGFRFAKSLFKLWQICVEIERVSV